MKYGTRIDNKSMIYVGMRNQILEYRINLDSQLKECDHMNGQTDL